MVEKRNLYFRKNGEHRLLRENVTEKEALAAMRQFMDERNFKSYYTRVWNIPEGTMYDVGSHTEFFLWGVVNV